MSAHFKHEYPIEIILDWTPGNIDIPLDWSAEQADTFVSIIGHLEEKIWTLYGDDLAQLAQHQSLTDSLCEDDPDSPDEDDIPF